MNTMMYFGKEKSEKRIFGGFRNKTQFTVYGHGSFRDLQILQL